MAQDFSVHASLCNELLQHYQSQYADRRVYWSARSRSECEGDLVTLICDSFDRSKLQLPMWPLNRCPKRTVYETLQRALLALSFLSLEKQYFVSWSLSLSAPWDLRSKPGVDRCSMPWAWLVPLFDLARGNECWQQLELGVRFLS